MHEIIKNYIDKKNKDYQNRLEKEKELFLLERDLYEKEYSPHGIYDNEYYFSEWDKESNTTKYYKKKAIEISDEDYEELLKVERLGVKKITPSNSIATSLKAIAIIIYILGGIASIVLAPYEEYLFFTASFNTFILGTMFLGFSEKIKLLHQINNKE